MTDLIAQNMDMSAITEAVTNLSKTLAEASEAGLSAKSTATIDAYDAMDAANQINQERKALLS